MFFMMFQCEEERRKEIIEDWERHKEGKGYRSKKYKKTVRKLKKMDYQSPHNLMFTVS